MRPFPPTKAARIRTLQSLMRPQVSDGESWGPELVGNGRFRRPYRCTLVPPV